MKIVHSKIIGEGAPLLILHGYFGMSDNWKSLGNKFGEDFQIHLIDQRNHGRSFHAGNFDYDLLVEDIVQYIKHHQLEKVIVLGHSMGGKAAMLFAVKYPTLVAKLIIVDIAPRYYQPHHTDILKALNSVDFLIHNTRKLVDQKIAELIPDIGVRSFLLKNVYWKEKGLLAYRFNLQSLTENNSEVGKALPSFTTFDGETLFLAGGNSGYITESEVPMIKAHFPKATIKTIANVGHWLHAEKPKAFYELVMRFLKK
ncbi:MAG: alpha/beta fold hydrolase [Flavobacterium sp.]|jgi:esterase|nr:alpha/beta fold hydrolase [Flavobacterium sp.]MBT5289969.1 alpha/beta fold hydrolase [Flavobacterium sp.]MBT6377283.1 alpha/beta fold hydrolase [Flavobacterium sp.]MBT6882256.1 alpha/beta fold hydrolase [Flavobacterium sp.]MBT7424826.1 alpha/beta fold hydrolase [Flavobacterium sp.]